MKQQYSEHCNIVLSNSTIGIGVTIYLFNCVGTEFEEGTQVVKFLWSLCGEFEEELHSLC